MLSEMKGSRRRIVMQMPVEAMVGKLSPKSSSLDPNRYGTHRFYVGFQTRVNVRNFFQARTKERSVPYSAAEVAVHDKFRVVQAAALARRMDTTKTAIDTAQFKQQRQYATFEGFVFVKGWNNYDDTSGTVIWPD